MNKKYKQHIIFNIYLEKKVIYTKWIKIKRILIIKVQKMKVKKIMVNINNKRFQRKVIGQINKIKNIIGFYKFIISILFLNI